MDENNKQQNTPSCENQASVVEVSTSDVGTHDVGVTETSSGISVEREQKDADCAKRSGKEQREQQLEDAKSNFANREVTEPKRKKRWLSTVFFVAVIALTVVLMYQLSESAASGNEKSLTEIFANIRVDYAIAAVAVLLTMMFLDSMKYFIIIHATTGKFRYAMALKTGLWGKYYDNITPFASGGQPFQVHYLYKKGFTGGESTAIISIKFCFNILMWLAICGCLMAFNRGALDVYVADETQRNLFRVMGWIGFGVNFLIPLTIITFALFPKITETLLRWLMTLGHKLHIVKNKEAIVLKAKRGANDFRSSFVIMARKPLHAILLLLCCICEPFLSMTLPFFVVVALGGNAIAPSWELLFAIMTLNVYVSMSVTVIPTPGNSGAMESAFLLILTSVAEGVLFWSVFTWRLLSYYSYIIIGLCVFVVDFVRKFKRNRA